ncbi:MAG TPA: baseplate J/gp47 family protein [Herpetosiphonaceae bacterium]
MSNKPSNDRGGRRPSARIEPSLPLSQVGREEEPLLIPIPPQSSIEEICNLVRGAGAARVELLVPDGTRALQSIAGNEMLREAAKASGVRVTLFTADEKTTDAARFAKLDVVSVGGTVAAPRPGDTPRRPTAQRPAIQPPTPPLTPRPPTQPASGTAQPTRQAAPSTPLAASDADFLSQLEAIDHAADAEAPRVQRSEQGALLYDVPGDIGVPSPAQNDAEWQAAFGELDTAMSRAPEEEDLPPLPPRRRPRRASADDVVRERAPRPSLLGALLGVLPQRSRRVADEAAPPDDEGFRMARPERTAEEVAARRRQSRTLLLGPLLALLLITGLVLIVLSSQGSLNFGGFWNSLGLGTPPTITVEPPLSSTEAVTFTDQLVPLVGEPINDPASINVQGVVLTVPVTVTVQGTAAGRAVTPIGFAKGGVTLRNQTSQPVTIPAGTIVAAGGQEFVFDNNVTVPGSRDTGEALVYGFADGTLTARLPGSQGNIPPGTIVAIPGYTSRQFTVSQPAPFTGGSDEEVTIVSPDDVSPLLPQALTDLYARGVTGLQAQVQERPNLSISAGQITPTQELLRSLPPEEYSSVFPPIGQVTQDGAFTLQVFRTFEALANPSDRPIDAELRRAILNLIRQQRPDLGSAEISINGWRRGDQGLIVEAVAVPRGGYQELPESLREEIAQAIRGKARDEAETYLRQLEEEGQIRAFGLPQDWQTVPDNVTVTVDTTASGASQ